MHTATLALSILILIASQCMDKRCFKIKFFLSAVLLVSVVTWFFLDTLSGNGFDYATLYHLRTGLTGAGVGDFKYQIAQYMGAVIAVIAFSAGAAWVSIRLSRVSGFFIGLYSVAAAAIFAISPLTLDFVKLAEFMKADDSGGISKLQAEYVRPVAKENSFKKKNIVIVYAESLERTYLDQKSFPGLMPNIQRLAAGASDYTDVRASDGTGWTIAGIVASMCGVPLTVWRPEDANELGRLNNFLPGASCISDFLSTAGYSLEFMGGADSEFAGKAKFLSGHGFTSVRDRNYFKGMNLPAQDFSSWGLHDDVLLEQAGTRFDELSGKNSPFLLSVLTLDTHHPSGHVPKACGDMEYAGLDERFPILDAVACSDLLISRFVDRILAGPYANDTIVVLLSDHLGMPNDARKILESMDRRNLLLLFDSDIAAGKVSAPATSVDVGAILLSALTGSDAGVGFGRVPQGGASDGLSRALFEGEDVGHYHAFAQGLWQLDKGNAVHLFKRRSPESRKSGNITSIQFGDWGWGRANELSLGADVSEMTSRGVDWVYVNYCAAFGPDTPAELCALESTATGEQYLYKQKDLVRGIDFRRDRPVTRKAQVKISSGFIVRNHFESDYPYLIKGVVDKGSVFSPLEEGVLFNGPFVKMPAGKYRVIVNGRASAASSAWADVIADGGGLVLARGPLRSSDAQSYDIYREDFNIDKDVENLEVRVYVGKEDAVRVDSFSVVPL
ncbi:MAG: sulfatase-like hydrolase/transferase [Stenotrophomonas maltophilia]